MKVVLIALCMCLGVGESVGLSASTLPNDSSKIPNSYFSQHELCESEILRAEQKYNIPSRLLLAIATVESGRQEKQKKRPWPWTICANKRGYFCSTKTAAIATVKRLLARGVKNIDVGCMQVNLLHHSDAFKNLEVCVILWRTIYCKFNCFECVHIFTDNILCSSCYNFRLISKRSASKSTKNNNFIILR